MKSKMKKIMIKVLMLLICSLIYLGIGYIAAIIISHQFTYTLQDALASEGIILILIGILMSMKGEPSGVNMSGFGRLNDNINTYVNNEVLLRERETKPYYKDFYNNNVLHVAFSNWAFILGGVFILVIGYILIQ